MSLLASLLSLATDVTGRRAVLATTLVYLLARRRRSEAEPAVPTKTILLSRVNPMLYDGNQHDWGSTATVSIASSPSSARPTVWDQLKVSSFW